MYFISMHEDTLANQTLMAITKNVLLKKFKNDWNLELFTEDGADSIIKPANI